MWVSVDNVNMPGASWRKLGDVLRGAVVLAARLEETSSDCIVICAGTNWVLGQQACQPMALDPVHSVLLSEEHAAGIPCPLTVKDPNAVGRGLHG